MYILQVGYPGISKDIHSHPGISRWSAFQMLHAHLSVGFILQDNIPECGDRCAVLATLGSSSCQHEVLAQMKLSSADGGLGVDDEL